MAEIAGAVCLVLLVRKPRVVGLVASLLVSITAGVVAVWALRCLVTATGLAQVGTGALLAVGVIGMVMIAAQLARPVGPRPAM
ncbi:hypothetical protein [Saccharopolyspora sp. 5N708]|uniref:hypothetical protein n=1 Tax=Saccharopolyspora sp. 5N708 TaxID=3457424 RepID=UPI003FD0F47A